MTNTKAILNAILHLQYTSKEPDFKAVFGANTGAHLWHKFHTMPTSSLLNLYRAMDAENAEKFEGWITEEAAEIEKQTHRG
jgi:hypothetical protein